MPLDETTAPCSTKLRELHKDPFDRMLICQPITGSLTLLTPDPLIKQHAVTTVW